MAIPAEEGIGAAAPFAADADNGESFGNGEEASGVDPIHRDDDGERVPLARADDDALAALPPAGLLGIAAPIREHERSVCAFGGGEFFHRRRVYPRKSLAFFPASAGTKTDVKLDGVPVPKSSALAIANQLRVKDAKERGGLWRDGSRPKVELRIADESRRRETPHGLGGPAAPFGDDGLRGGIASEIRSGGVPAHRRRFFEQRPRLERLRKVFFGIGAMRFRDERCCGARIAADAVERGDLLNGRGELALLVRFPNLNAVALPGVAVERDAEQFAFVGIEAAPAFAADAPSIAGTPHGIAVKGVEKRKRIVRYRGFDF